MTTRLLQEKFGAWLQEQQLSDRDKAWLGIVKEIKRSMSLRKPENITMKVHKPFAFIQFN
jgi:hypothetical protein